MDEDFISRNTLKKMLENILVKEKNVNIFLKNMDGLTTEEAYNVCGEILKLEKSDMKGLKNILSNLKSNKIGWNSDIYNEIRKKIEEFDDYLVNPFEVAEGVTTCSRCQSKKTFSCQKQTRSSDEPMTTFAKCFDCGNEMVYSG